MKTFTKIAIALAAGTITLAGVSTSFADGDKDRRGGGQRGAMMQMINEADADKSGTFSREEVSSFVADRFAAADANADGSVTVEELTNAIQQMRESRRAERFAEGMLTRLDINEDGSVTLEEVTQRQELMFALADVDASGVIEADELPQRGEGRRGEGRRGGNNAQ